MTIPYIEGVDSGYRKLSTMRDIAPGSKVVYVGTRSILFSVGKIYTVIKTWKHHEDRAFSISVIDDFSHGLWISSEEFSTSAALQDPRELQIDTYDFIYIPANQIPKASIVMYVGEGDDKLVTYQRYYVESTTEDTVYLIAEIKGVRHRVGCTRDDVCIEILNNKGELDEANASL